MMVSGPGIHIDLHRLCLVFYLKFKLKVSLRPFQSSCCMVLTCSGQPSSLVQVIQKFMGIVGDLDKPLWNLTSFNWSTGAPAFAVNDLLVR